MYNSSVAFSTLKSVDSGTYICSATVSPLTPTDNLIGSGTSEGDITISVGMYITSIFNPRRMRERVTVVGSVCVCLLYISLIECLFVPQTIRLT